MHAIIFITVVHLKYLHVPCIPQDVWNWFNKLTKALFENTLPSLYSADAIL